MAQAFIRALKAAFVATLKLSAIFKICLRPTCHKTNIQAYVASQTPGCCCTLASLYRNHFEHQRPEVFATPSERLDPSVTLSRLA